MTQNLPAVQQKAKDLRSYLGQDNIKDQFEMALPKWLSVDRLLRIVFSSTIKNPRILDCTRESILQSVMQCAQTGLEPILGRAHLIPYHNSKQINGKWVKVWECQFQPGYQGLVDLARRSGEIKDVFAMVVYENDDFDMEYGTNRKLEHRPTIKGDPGKPIGAYAVWELKDGTKPFEFMPLHKLYKRRDKSQAYQYAIKNSTNKNAQETPWIQWPEEQMMKTVVKHSSKLKPASIEYMEAVELDSAIDSGRKAIGFYDSGLLMAPEKTEFTAEDFDKLFEAMADSPDPAFDKYLEEMAGAQEPKMSVDQFKVESAAQFEELWAHFENWRKDKPPAAGKSEPKPPTSVFDPWNEKVWRNLRKSGFPKHVYENLATFKEAPAVIQAKVVSKWDTFFPGTPFPTVEDQAGIAKEPVAREPVKTIEKEITPGQLDGAVAGPVTPDPFVGLKNARESLGEDAYAVACESVFGEPERFPKTPEETKSVAVYMNQIAKSGAEV